MTNNEITNLLKPAFKWAKSCGANHFDRAFRLSPQFTNFCKTGTLMTIIFGKKFYWKNGYFIKKVENSSNGNIITELMDRTGAVIGSYIETDLPVMNHKV